MGFRRGIVGLSVPCMMASGTIAIAQPPAVVTTPPVARPPTGEAPDSNSDPRYAAEDIAHGAVLCTWSLMLGVKAVGEKCHAREDDSFASALAGAIADMDRFIAANGTPRTAALAAQAREVSTTLKREDICTPDGERLYEIVRSRGPAALREAVARMLAVPRPPVMNPCV